MVLFFLLVISCCRAQTDTNNLTPAQIEGHALAQQLCNGRPETNTLVSGTLKIRSSGQHSEVPVRFTTFLASEGWQATYQSGSGTNVQTLCITHLIGKPEQFALNGRVLAGADLTTPFASSDFWAIDLGVDFFHWPEQTVLKHEMRRGRSCKVLESTNPNPSPDGYSRVLSWIDSESSGIVHAEAYDAKNALLKEFDPKSFKKVNGQWQLEDMDIRNDQTGSRTRIEFNVDDK